MSIFTRAQAPKPSKGNKILQDMQYLRSNLLNAVGVCKDLEQDLCIVISGYEGSGKSTLASHICKILDPDFRIDDTIIFDFKEGKNNYVDFYEKNENNFYKVAWFDEAITVFFAQDHSSKESKEAQKLFKINRASRHFNILIAPSLWDLVPNIRNKRVKIFIYTYYTIKVINGHRFYTHKYAFYAKDKVVKISHDKKAMAAFSSPKEFLKLCKPDFIEYFPSMPMEIKTQYEMLKHSQRLGVIREIKGEKELEQTLNDIDFSNAFEGLKSELVI